MKLTAYKSPPAGPLTPRICRLLRAAETVVRLRNQQPLNSPRYWFFDGCLKSIHQRVLDVEAGR